MLIDFSSIVLMYHTQAMIALGKLINPITGATEKNLEQAQLFIDILSVLEEKTKGNLDSTEKSLLDDSLRNLRLNYVSEYEASKAAETETKKG